MHIYKSKWFQFVLRRVSGAFFFLLFGIKFNYILYTSKQTERKLEKTRAQSRERIEELNVIGRIKHNKIILSFFCITLQSTMNEWTNKRTNYWMEKWTKHKKIQRFSLGVLRRQANAFNVIRPQSLFLSPWFAVHKLSTFGGKIIIQPSIYGVSILGHSRHK